jgi:hypothetical protein
MKGPCPLANWSDLYFRVRGQSGTPSASENLIQFWQQQIPDGFESQRESVIDVLRFHFQRLRRKPN